MSIAEIWDGIKQFFKPTADSLTKEKFDNGLRDTVEQFRSYGLKQPTVFYVYNGLFTKEINDFLKQNTDNLINYFVPDSNDDYVAILGAEEHGEKYILFRVYDEEYNRRLGNYMRVQQWPDLGQPVRRIDEVFRELYDRYGSK